MAEPPEERMTQDHAGVLITIAYTYYVLSNQAQALQIARDACTCFPNDALLTRIVELLSSREDPSYCYQST